MDRFTLQITICTIFCRRVFTGTVSEILWRISRIFERWHYFFLHLNDGLILRFISVRVSQFQRTSSTLERVSFHARLPLLILKLARSVAGRRSPLHGRVWTHYYNLFVNKAQPNCYVIPWKRLWLGNCRWMGSIIWYLIQSEGGYVCVMFWCGSLSRLLSERVISKRFWVWFPWCT